MVHMLSTQHRDDAISRENNNKPLMILDYNATKGGVDNADKLITQYIHAQEKLLVGLIDYL